jgi:glycine/D-amino acid oxidase-like deaminating enzyme
MIGPPDGVLLPGALRRASSHGLLHRTLTGKEASEEFPGLSLDDDLSVIHDPEAGIVFAQQAISTCVRHASSAGTEFRYEEPVTGWNRSGGLVRGPHR